MANFDQDPRSNKPPFDRSPTGADGDVGQEDKILKTEKGIKGAQPQLSTEEQLEKITGDIGVLQEEMARLNDTVEGTKTQLNEARAELGLSATEQDPPSVLLDRERLKKLQNEQQVMKKQKEELESDDNESGKQQEEGEGGEGLKENDLVVSEFGIGPAKKLLDQHNIPYNDREYTKRKVLDAKTDTAVPGEWVLTLSDPDHRDRPLSFDGVKKVFQLLKDSNIAVRYGKNPERG